MGTRPDDVALIVLDQATAAIRTDDRTMFGVDLTPGVAEGLTALKKARLRRVALAPDARKADLLVLHKHLPAFDDVVNRPPPSAAIVVAADRVMRARLSRSGGVGYPHAALAAVAATRQEIVFACLRGSRLVLERLQPMVPYFVERQLSGEWLVFAAITRSALATAVARGVEIEVLPLDFTREDPLLAHLDAVDDARIEALAKHRVLWRAGGRALIALGPDLFNDDIPLHGIHGHFLSLAPRPDLLRMQPPPRGARAAQLVAGRLPQGKVRVDDRLRDLFDILFRSCPASAASFQSDVDRYSGAANLDAAGAIASRHIRHADNARAVQALLAEL